MIIHPGPATIAPRSAPDGYVVHFYAATEPPRLVHTSHIAINDLLDVKAFADADVVDEALADDEAVCIVIYDGDTGDRVNEPDIAKAFGIR